MKVFTFAAGLAAGYVLGSRAGRDKYEQIVAGYEKVSSHPTTVKAQEKAKQFLHSGADTAIAKLDPTTPGSATEPVTATPRPARRKSSVAPNRLTDPLD